MAEKLCGLKKKGGGGGSEPKMKRISGSWENTILNQVTFTCEVGKTYIAGAYCGTIGTVSAVSGATDFTVLYNNYEIIVKFKASATSATINGSGGFYYPGLIEVD